MFFIFKIEFDPLLKQPTHPLIENTINFFLTLPLDSLKLIKYKANLYTLEMIKMFFSYLQFSFEVMLLKFKVIVYLTLACRSKSC